jgi:hypothetical protein
MGKKRLTLVAALLCAAICLALACASARAAPEKTSQPSWNEVSWPFPMDQWGKGKAFVCKAAECGAEVTVYIRAKIGFCNCTTGVADDAELDRISDFDLFENRLSALGAGKPIAVAWMKGRSRAFGIIGNPRSARSALCPEPVEQAVLDFLNSRTVLRWAEVTLGL